MIFLNDLHKNNYLRLTQNAGIHNHDIERISLFYIISGNEELYNKKNFIYDFHENFINIDCLDSADIDLSSSLKNLIRIGFNLYNGYMDEKINPLWTLASLDSVNFMLLMNAIHLRFNKKTNCDLNKVLA